MNSQDPKSLWDRNTCLSAALSALLATAVALAVCAFRGESVALGQQVPVRVSQSRTAPFSAVNGGE
jgi:hypothetical protein